MEISRFVVDHGFEIVESVGIVGSLLLAAAAFRREAESRRIGNLIALTQSHHSIWKELLRDPRLKRILNAKTPIPKSHLTREERIAVNMVVQQLYVAFHAIKKDLTVAPEGLREDVQNFFGNPIPRQIWEDLREFQDREFVAFVEECLALV